MTHPTFRCGVAYDFRNPPGSGLSDTAVYGSILDQAVLVDRAQRLPRTMEGLEILRQAWSGERFTHRGAHWAFEDVQIYPRPVQAAMTAAGARRAGRLGLNLLPQGDRHAVLDPWRAEMAAHGRDPDQYRVGIIRGALVTDDPERDWAPLREAERYKAARYADWIGGSGDTYTFMGAGGDVISQRWLIGDAATVRAALRRFVLDYGLTDLVTVGNCPGVPAAQLNASLERLAQFVLPGLREDLAAY